MNATSHKQQLLNTLHKPYKECTGCHFNMPVVTQIVFGEGNPDTKIVFIGEAPGREEDLQGKPFVGRSGKLLNRILESAHAPRETIFITNLVKCRPPNNRRPLPAEIAASKPLLLGQIKIINPKIICTLGSSALEGLIDRPIQITKERGKPLVWNGITVFPTYHPAYILRNPKELETLVRDISAAISLSFR
jgi:DNA polymerase